MLHRHEVQACILFTVEIDSNPRNLIYGVLVMHTLLILWVPTLFLLLVFSSETVSLLLPCTCAVYLRALPLPSDQLKVAK